jgi:FkbM family methyltransferase
LLLEYVTVSGDAKTGAAGGNHLGAASGLLPVVLGPVGHYTGQAFRRVLEEFLHTTPKSWLARKLAPYPRLFAAAKQLLYRAGGTVYRTEHEWLRSVFGDRKDVFFLQICANDGKSDDCLYPFVRAYSWRGVLMEPVRHLFDRLIANYQGADGLIFVNKALAEHDGKRTFYRLRETSDAMPPWYQEIGSLRREVILSHQKIIPNIDEYIMEEHVECISFSTLVENYNLRRLDLILIDTEGYDFNILRVIDFEKFCPALVIYEEKHLSAEDKAAARRLLLSHGYVVHAIGANAAATRTAFYSRGYWHRSLRMSAIESCRQM